MYLLICDSYRLKLSNELEELEEQARASAIDSTQSEPTVMRC